MATITPDPAVAPGPRAASGGGAERPPGGRRLRWPRRPSWPALVIAFISYVPLLFTARGYVGADTKAYLYINPDQLLARAPYLWDSYVGMGGVTHQNIGYLLPQGPWYWVFEHLQVPDWVAQRLWTGTLLFIAGTGVLAMLRTFGWRNRPAFLAASVYLLSPYVLEYVARISAILLPWAWLPWMVAFVVRGLRYQASHTPLDRPDHRPRAEGDDENDDDEAGHLAGFLHSLARWRYPALFALTIALVGGSNATSLIYAGLAPTVWLPFALIRREVGWRDMIAFLARLLVLTIAVCAWWVSGLVSQAGYGLDVLAYSETVKTVASDSQASEALRGLGNWYFYGRDGISAWIQPSLEYTENLWILAVSFAVPILALVAAVCVRWVHRAYFVALVLVGITLTVGVYPYESPSPAGSVFKAFAEGSTAGLALRSTPRAVPLAVLGLGVLLAAGLEALFRLPVFADPAGRLRRARHAVAGSAAKGRGRLVPIGAYLVVLALVLINMIPLFRGQFVDPNLRRPEALPSYLTDIAKDLDASPRLDGAQTRVLELPGADFSQYRWGATLDPPLPGLMNRPYVSRELIPSGTPQSAALVRALDRRLQEGVYETRSLPSLARIMGVGDVVLRSDLQYERFRTPQPISTWATWTRLRPEGLAAPKEYGPRIAETPVVPFVDEITLANSPTAQEPPAMADFAVTNPSPIVRAERAEKPLLVAGDSEGLVDASAAGLLDSTGTIRFAASQKTADAAAVPSDADLLLTDSNRKRAERWGTVRENYGYVETATGKPLAKDPNDARLPIFPDETTADQTVALYRGVQDIEASEYGNAVSYAPSDRPYYAFDGDLTTSWKVGAFADPRGQRIRVSLLQPTTADHVTLVQPLVGGTRTITKAKLTFSGGSFDKPESVTVDLGGASLTRAGQRVAVPGGNRSFEQVEFTIEQTSNGTLRQYDGQSGVGLAELSIPGVKADELLRLPTDLFSAAGTDGAAQPLSVMLTRDRANPQEPFKTDTELSMARQFTLPTARTFALSGTARISTLTSDPTLDTVLGRGTVASLSPAPADVVTTTASASLPGDLSARPPAAFDGNPKTAWQNAFGGNIGSWIQFDTDAPKALSGLDLQIIADGKHSVPTKLRLDVTGGTSGTQSRTITLPAVQDAKTQDATVRVPVSFAPVAGTKFRLTVVEQRRETTTDYFNHGPLELPIGIAEVGADQLRAATLPTSLPGTCRSDLLTLDGKPISVQIGGATTAAVSLDGLALQLCGDSTSIQLAAGTHVLRTARGSATGINVDRLLLSSAATRAAADATDPFPGEVRTTQGDGTPHVVVTGEGPVAYRLSVKGAEVGKPFWLVLGQSLSPGWKAKIVGGSTLAAPQLVDAYANGWLITPTSADFEVSLDWTPQSKVWIGIAVSAVALLICLLMVLRRDPTHPRYPADGDPLADGDGPPDLLPPALQPGGEATPVLVSPFARDAGPLPTARAVVATVVAAGLAAVLITPLAGLLTLVAMLVGLLVPRGRTLLRVGSVACLLISALYVLQVQARYHLPETGQWVQAFHKVATLSWLTVAFLVADVLVGWARRDVPRLTGQPPATDEPPTSKVVLEKD